MAEKVLASDFQEFNNKRFTKKDLFRLEACTVFMLNFLPGQKMPAHNHLGQDLIFNILQGSGELKIGEALLNVKEAEVIHGNGDHMISFLNTGTEKVSIHVVMHKRN